MIAYFKYLYHKTSRKEREEAKGTKEDKGLLSEGYARI